MVGLERSHAAGDDQLIPIFEDDPAPKTQAPPMQCWKVAIIDDDAAVHDGTRFALSEYRLNGRGLTFLSALSAAEGRRLLEAHPDIAVIFLDVVMETDKAGLELVDFVRRQLRNTTVRIVLRTAQPGHAPEQRVVIDYDINDYKSKTELKAEKLFTTMTAALRSFEQLRHLIRMQQGLEAIANAASSLHQARTVAELADVALAQMKRFVAGAEGGLLLGDLEATGDLVVLAGTGSFEGLSSTRDLEGRLPAIHDAVEEVLVQRASRVASGAYIGWIAAGSLSAILVVEIPGEPDEADCALLDVFLGRLTAALENVSLYEALEEANASLEHKVEVRSAQLTAANDRLVAQADELRRVNALKNELLGTVAHDLKNPLGVILGRAEILRDALVDQTTDIPFARFQVDEIMASARRLSGIVAEKIADAQRDIPSLPLNPQVFDLAELVREVVDSNRAPAGRKRQRIHLHAAEAMPVLADADRIVEALDNVVGNAVKYSPFGGTIDVAVTREGAEAVVRVADSGPGISDADMARLFLPFERLSALPTGGESSTGLGLYCAKRNVDLCGGRIGGEPLHEGGGSRFFIALPLHTAVAQ